MQKITKNIFGRGRNTDTDKNSIKPDSYLEAKNVEIVADGDFTALKNLKGTTLVQNVINNGSPEVIGAFETLYKIGNTPNKKCITIITVSDAPTTVVADLGQAQYEGHAPFAFEGIDADAVLEPQLGQGTYTGLEPASVQSVATITVRAIAKSPGATNPAARYHYRVNGGSWVYFQQATVGTVSYSIINSFEVPEGATVDLAVQNTSDQNIFFGDGNGSGDWNSAFGKSAPYTFTATASSDQYLNLDVEFADPIYRYVTS